MVTFWVALVAIGVIGIALETLDNWLFERKGRD